MLDGSVVPCLDASPTWKRAWRALIASPPSILLALLGTAMLVLGIMLKEDAVGVTLIILAAGTLSFGVVLPNVQKAQVGTTGFTLEMATRVRDEEYAPLLAGHRESLQRLAYLLTGSARQAADLSGEALTRAYADWHRIPSDERLFYLSCAVTRHALGMAALGLLGAQEEDPADSEGADPRLESEALRNLLALPPRLRAVAVLRHYQDLDESQIGRALDLQREEVEAAVADAEARLASARYSES